MNNPDNIWICPKCKDITYEQDLPLDYKCEECDGIYIDTGKTDDDWKSLFIQTHQGKNHKNTTAKEVDTFIQDTFLQEYDTVDTEAVAKREKATQEWLDELDRNIKSKPVSCPKCGSTSISTQKRGFKWGRAIAGAALTGFVGTGLVAGAAGSNKMINVCQRCGHQWEPR